MTIHPRLLRLLTERNMLVAMALAGFALRVVAVDAHGLWMDEVSSVEGASHDIGAIFTDRFGLFANQTPWYYLLVRLTLLIADPTTTTLFVRLPGILAGALLPVATYKLGSALFGRTVGAVAAMPLVLAAVFLDYSQEARPYMLVALGVVLSVYSLVKAQASHGVRTWVAFAFAAAATMLLSYTAVTFAMPPLFLLLAWALFGARKGGRRVLLAAVAVSAGLLLLAIAQSADLSHYSPRQLPPVGLSGAAPAAAIGLYMFQWAITTGLGEGVERTISLVVVLLALLGALRASRRGGAERGGMVVCGIMVIVPPVIAGVLSSTTPLFERYLMFVIPFCFLLAANGGVTLVRWVAGKLSLRAGRLVAVGGALLALAPFLVSAFVYFSPAGHAMLSYRPDYRGVAHFISDHATPDDTVIIIDTPVHGHAVTDFYWKGSPPAHVFDAHDPLLFASKSDGDVYWVIRRFSPATVDSAAPKGRGWDKAVNLESVLLRVEPAPPEGLLARTNLLLGVLEQSASADKRLMVTRGSLQQAAGDIAGAAQTFYNAGVFFPLGAEYLRTAEGLVARGNAARGWIIAMMGRHDEPANAAIHEWLAEQLRQRGYEQQANDEAEIARLLRSAMGR